MIKDNMDNTQTEEKKDYSDLGGVAAGGRAGVVLPACGEDPEQAARAKAQAS